MAVCSGSVTGLANTFPKCNQQDTTIFNLFILIKVYWNKYIEDAWNYEYQIRKYSLYETLMLYRLEL
jgi:hypothetical protein